MKIAIFGGIRNRGGFARLFCKDVEIAFFIDNSLDKVGEMLDGIEIYSPYKFPQGDVDYIVVFIYEYILVNQELMDLGVAPDKIVNFNDSAIQLSQYGIFNEEEADKLRIKLKLDYMDRRIEELENNLRYFEENYFYEAVEKIKNHEIRIPRVCSIENTCEKILSEKCSMSRYGGGEFDIILGRARDIYQCNNQDLAKRLKDILASNQKNHIIALADNYGAMEGLRKENKNTIRKYMAEGKREEHYALLDMKKEYYNAYISRPYVIYPHDDIQAARKRFDALRQIWDKRHVLFVEGDRTRMGVGNDLFDNAACIERIIAPNENAFDVYDKIYAAALIHGKDKLIIIALGPTATVLAYDLAMVGYWALDMGHIDLEYEWFLKGKGYCYIPHKYNNEMLSDTQVTDISCPDYEASILCRIEV